MARKRFTENDRDPSGVTASGLISGTRYYKIVLLEEFDRMPHNWKLAELPFLVGIPVPCLDSKGRRIREKIMQAWVGKAVVELTACFGGATPLKAPARNRVGRRVLIEKDQTLVLSGCGSLEDFLRHRSRILSFAKRMGVAMSQYAVFVLAYPSHSFLVIDENTSL